MNESDFQDVHVKTDTMELNIDVHRWYARFAEGQRWLEEQIVRDMEPYIPIRTGTLRAHIRNMNYANLGDEQIIAYSRPTPAYPRFMYEGYNTNGKPMRFSNPLARERWFDVAKEAHYYEWVNGLKERIVGR